MSKKNENTATLRKATKPRPEKVREAKATTGAALRQAKKQYESNLPGIKPAK